MSDLRWRNANARHPDVIAAQRRERTRVRGERHQRWGRPPAQAASPTRQMFMVTARALAGSYVILRPGGSQRQDESREGEGGKRVHQPGVVRPQELTEEDGAR